MTFETLKNDPAYYFHHSASREGYVSRKLGRIVEPYKGKFGEGYIVLHARWDTTRFVYVSYYIKKEG